MIVTYVREDFKEKNKKDGDVGSRTQVQKS